MKQSSGLFLTLILLSGCSSSFQDVLLSSATTAAQNTGYLISLATAIGQNSNQENQNRRRFNQPSSFDVIRLENNQVWTLVTDKNHHRVLIYSESPVGLETPVRILGQPHIEAIDPVGFSRLYFPSRARFIRTGPNDFIIVILDTGNDRVVFYNGIPEENNAEPDYVLDTVYQGTSPPSTPANWQRFGNVDDACLAAGIFYISDRGSHRIVAYQWHEIISSMSTLNPAQPEVDFLIGQSSLQGTQPNGSNSNTTSLNAPSGLACDDTLGLAVADSGNHRVLHWVPAPFSQYSPNHVYGQESYTIPSTTCANPSASNLCQPRGVSLQYGANGTNYALVADYGNDRIMGFPVTTTLGPQAELLMGLDTFTDVTQTSRRLRLEGDRFRRPIDIKYDSVTETFHIADQDHNRIMHYLRDSDAPTPTFFPRTALGTANLHDNGVTALNFIRPTDMAVDASNGAFYVVDNFRHRILYWPEIPSEHGVESSALIGQRSVFGYKPNQGLAAAEDTLSSPHGVAAHEDFLFVTDRNNHRVLVFQGSPTSNFSAARLVFGQSDFAGNAPNRGAPDNIPIGPDWIKSPTGIFKNENYFVVADGNGRLLIWDLSTPLPIQGTSEIREPDFAIGSDLFMIPGGTPVGAGTIGAEAYMTIHGQNLLVSDTHRHRVLIFDLNELATGMEASVVLGQQNFNAARCERGPASLCSPKGLSVDPAGNLHVADTGNNRILVFRGIPITNGVEALGAIGQPDLNASNANSNGVSANGLSSPVAVLVAIFGTIILDAANDRALRWFLQE